MPRRYSYTPRRSGPPRRVSGGSAPVLPIVVAAVVVVFGALLLFRGDGSTAANPDGPVAAIPVGGSVTPAVAGAQQTPVRTIKPAPVPQISALSAAIIEEPCGAVVWSANEDTHYPSASLTKIVTALVAVDDGGLDRMVDITVDGSELARETDATVMGLVPGQRLSMTDLLYGLLMRSGNDAAIQIAEAVAGTQEAFVARMNAKMISLGLEDTHFANPHGLDAASHYTSAYDIAMLGHELMKVPLLARIVGTQKYQPNWGGPAIENLNLMLTGYEGSIGIKTGFTDQASETIVAAAADTGRVLIVSALKSSDRYRDAGRLLDWGFASTASAC